MEKTIEFKLNSKTENANADVGIKTKKEEI